MLLPSIFDDVFALDDFDDMFRIPRLHGTIDNRNRMHSDIKEMEHSYLIEIDLPGYAKEDVTAELKSGYLFVRAQKSESDDEKDKKGNYIRRERYTGSCQRSFYVGDHIKQEEIEASFKDGTLRIEVPKKEVLEETEKTDTIEIKDE